MAEGDLVMQINLGPWSACSRRHRLRRGTTTVEFALIALPLILFIFASIEFGRAMMAMQTLEESARAGCRTAILGGATIQNVETAVDDALSGSGIRNYTVAVNPTSLESMQRWAPVTVRVRSVMKAA